MTPQALKTLAFVLAAALSALAALAIPQVDAFDPVITALAGVLVGWSGLKRPGDS